MTKIFTVSRCCESNIDLIFNAEINDFTLIFPSYLQMSPSAQHADYSQSHVITGVGDEVLLTLSVLAIATFLLYKMFLWVFSPVSQPDLSREQRDIPGT